MQKHAIVTGGAGFIGSHLIPRLLQEGWKVTAIDNFDPFYSPAIKQNNLKPFHKHPDFHFYPIDILDLKSLQQTLIGKFDAIIHIAAKAGVRPSIKNPLAYQKVNVLGTQNMLEISRALDIKQFVFASSSSVYGVNPNTPWSEEDHVLQPISPYASSKISAELLGHVYAKLYDIRFIALRFFTVYGPGQRPDLAIHKFADKIRNNMPIQMYGDGSTERDYTYVEDIVNGVVAAIHYHKTKYEIINLGNNRTVSLREMIQTIEEVFGQKAIIERLPMQPGDVPKTCANIDKAKHLLGYQPQTPFRKGVEKFKEWLISNANIIDSDNEGGLKLEEFLEVT